MAKLIDETKEHKRLLELIHLPRPELERVCQEEHENYADDEQHCPACWILGASDAGIPRSVIAGKTALKDHFSQSYIDSQCGRAPKREED